MLVGLVTRDFLHGPFWPVFFGSFVALGVTLGGLYKALRRSQDRERAEYERLENEIAAMSLEGAKLEAERLLREPGAFQVVAADSPAGTPVSSLPPLVQELFGRYESIVDVHSAAELTRIDVGPSTLRSDLYRIGIHTEHSEVAVGSGSEEVYILADDVPEAEAVEETYQSVYHYLVGVHRSFAS